MRTIIAAMSLVSLAACTADEVSQSPVSPPDAIVVPTPSPSPTPAPTPTPTPVPTPTPSPTPSPIPSGSPLNDGKTIIVAEGDSITSPQADGVYSGAFKAAHPKIEFYITAVGGSGLNNVLRRQQDDMALKPDILTLFIGANDFGDDPANYADRVFKYAEPFRAMGTKVYVATLLPKAKSDGTISAERNHARRVYAQIIEDAVGTKIDGIIDFGRHEIMGHDGAPLNLQLYKDGLHPTWRGHGGGYGGHDYLLEIYTPIVEKAIKNLP